MAPHDRFQLLDSVPKASVTVLNIAGVHVYLYGVEELTPAQAKDTTVLFHVHGRTRTYKDTEGIAHQLVHEWRQRGSAEKGLVVATFDNRNHGTRAIDEISIQDWASGNPKHAQDMLSMIDGIVADIQITTTFLESYVQDVFSPTNFIITGFSLGGHVTWDVLAKEPRILAGIAIVGSPSLTPLLLDRLGGYKTVEEVPAGTKEWPKSVEKLYLGRDESVAGIRGKKVLILNGAVDALVPSKFTHSWVERFAKGNNVTFVEQPENGHWLSVQMMDKIVDWVVETVV